MFNDDERAMRLGEGDELFARTDEGSVESQDCKLSSPLGVGRVPDGWRTRDDGDNADDGDEEADDDTDDNEEDEDNEDEDNDGEGGVESQDSTRSSM